MNFTLLIPVRILLSANGRKVRPSIKFMKESFSTFPAKRTIHHNEKVVPFVEKAITDINDGAKLLVGGYGLCGIPEATIEAILKKGVKDLTIVSNNCGVDNFGLGLLLKEKRIKRIIASFVGQNSELEKSFHAGEVEVELVPQGTLAERIRAGGAGIPAFFTPAALGTLIEEGGVPIKYAPDGNVEVVSEKRETHQFNGKDYVLEHAITADFAIVKAWRADCHGNLVFRKTARNFNPVMCRAAAVTIAEVEEFCESLEPDSIHVPCIYVNRLFLTTCLDKRVENLTYTKGQESESALSSSAAVAGSERILKRAALELQKGMYVNIGIGLPSQLIDYIPAKLKVMVHSETGILGVGAYPVKSKVDPDLINAEKQTVSEAPGASYFSSEDSFSMIRGGHLDVAVIGAMEVSQYGDIASWIVPGKVMKGIGSSMDVVTAPNTKIIVAMEHTLKDGKPKIVEQCSLPLTGTKCASLIITEKGVFTVHPEEGLTLVEMAEGVEIAELLMSTGCNFAVAPELKVMGQVETPQPTGPSSDQPDVLDSILKTTRSA